MPSRGETVGIVVSSVRCRVAVLIPVFNDQAGLDASLDSLSMETPPFEIVIVDDGSANRVQAPATLANGVRVKVIRAEANLGIEGALNLGLEDIAAAGFEYVARLDAGDLIVPGRIALQTSVLDRNEGYAMVGSAAEFVDQRGQTLFVQRGPSRSAELRRAFHINNPVCHPTVMMRMSSLEVSGYYGYSYPAAEDYELFWRLMRTAGGTIVDQVTVKTIASPGGLSRSRRKLQLRSRLRLQLRYFSFRKLEAYRGVLQTIMLWWLPWKLVDRLKVVKSRSHLPRRGGG